MASLEVYNLSGEKIAKSEVPDSIFKSKINQHVVYETVRAQLLNKRRGTASTKGRSEVSGGGRKPWRQKGTGRARQGSIRSPQWRGGGVVFGPKPKSFAVTIPKKVKRLALKSILSNRYSYGKVFLIDALEMKKPSTKQAQELLTNLKLEKPLFIVDAAEKNLFSSLKNLSGAFVIKLNNINTYDIVNSDCVVFTKKAVSRIEEAVK